MVTKTYKIKQNGIDIFSITVKVPEGREEEFSQYEWDSKTGLVTAIDSTTGKRVVMEHEGNSLGKINPEDFEMEGINQLHHHYWYY